jgi:hypothetical protein
MKLSDPRDSRISCYSREHYKVQFKSESLGWLIQLAIRADLAAVIQRNPTDPQEEDPFAFTEIREKKGQIEDLIRKSHVIDEPALVSIGLSLYCFPTLAYLFSEPAVHSFVRQAKIGEIKQILESAHSHIERVDDRVQSGFNNLNGIDSLDGISDALEDLTPTKIRSVAQLADENLIDDLLFIVDMNAPTDLLVERFRDVIEGIKSSREPKNLYYELFLYGVLPFIDLADWGARNPDLTLTPDLRVAITLPQDSKGRYGPKQINEKTKPLANACRNTRGEVFTVLREAAAREIAAAIAFARDNSGTPVPEAMTEAWERWFPHTYPIDVYLLRRLDRAFPNPIEDIYRNNGLFDLSPRDRIRKSTRDTGVQTDALMKLGATLGF